MNKLIIHTIIPLFIQTTFYPKQSIFKKNKQSQFKTTMFYMSDHRESLGEHGLYLHRMPYFITPKEQIHVGSILWFGCEFSKDIEIELLNKKENTKLSHDGVSHITRVDECRNPYL